MTKELHDPEANNIYIRSSIYWHQTTSKLTRSRPYDYEEKRCDDEAEERCKNGNCKKYYNLYYYINDFKKVI